MTGRTRTRNCDLFYFDMTAKIGGRIERSGRALSELLSTVAAMAMAMGMGMVMAVMVADSFDPARSLQGPQKFLPQKHIRCGPCSASQFASHRILTSSLSFGHHHIHLLLHDIATI